MNYIWQDKDFPNFTFNLEVVTGIVQEFAIKLGEVHSLYETLSLENKEDFLVHIISAETQHTSGIEGEVFSREDVMSSVRMQLGLHNSLPQTRDKRILGISRVMLDVREQYETPLSVELIQEWHRILFQDKKMDQMGEWRVGPEAMQIVSGSLHNQKVDYEAPPASNVPQLMNQFIDWYVSFPYTDFGRVGRAMLRAALTHLYFETIHPFNDGNGRIGRALAEKALAETLNAPLFISLSQQIETDRNLYYENLKKAQRDLEVTEWLIYFFELIDKAEQQVKDIIIFTANKAKFFDQFNSQLSKPQRKAINKMFDAGPTGFKGGMTKRKYISITRTSDSTATRHLQYLKDIGALQMEGAGRSVCYHLVLD